VLNDAERHQLEALEYQIKFDDPGLATALRTMRPPPDGPTGWWAIPVVVVIAPLVYLLLLVAFGILATTIIIAIAVRAIAGGSRCRQHNRDRRH
jgi:hypothetical protein